MIDMHLHSLYSDGELKVDELSKRIKNANITHAVLTDHDCILGTTEFKDYCNNLDIKTIPGSELEAYYDLENNRYLHMLCYNYQDSKELNRYLENLRNDRIIAINTAIKKLNNKGINVNFSDVTSMSCGRHLLLNHLCMYLEKVSLVKSRYVAYNMFMDKTSEYHIKYPKPNVIDSMKKIEEVGGISVLAHPKRILISKEDLELYVEYLKKHGLSGIETYYGFNKTKETKFSKYLGEKYDLIQTIGSDWHCDSEGINFGNEFVLEKEQKVLRRRFFNE